MAMNIVNDRDVAKDIVQEVFLKLWKNQQSLAFGEQIKSYLYKATKNTALNHLEKNKKMQLWTDDMESMNSTEDHLYEDSGQKEALRQRVSQAIDQLPPKCKAIYMLCKHEGMKYAEVAEHLEVSLKTVENQMGIALKRLRSDLAPYLNMYNLAILVLMLASWAALN